MKKKDIEPQFFFTALIYVSYFLILIVIAVIFSKNSDNQEQQTELIEMLDYHSEKGLATAPHGYLIIKTQ